MADETTILGVIELYDKNAYEEVSNALIGHTGNNIFNISLNKTQLNNKGSILIPFAKCFRAKDDENNFIDENIQVIIKQLSFIKLFSIEVFIDSYYLKRRRYLYIFEEGKISIEKFIINFSPIIE